MVDCTFYKSTIKSNCILSLCHVRVRSSRQERPATLLKKRLCHRCFPVNFAKFLNTLFLQIISSGCFWRSRVNLHSTVLELLARKSAISAASVNSNFMDIYPLKHRSNNFFLLCCRLLDSFNENLLRQRGLDKYFLERFLLVSTLSC